LTPTFSKFDKSLCTTDGLRRAWGRSLFVSVRATCHASAGRAGMTNRKNAKAKFFKTVRADFEKTQFPWNAFWYPLVMISLVFDYRDKYSRSKKKGNKYCFLLKIGINSSQYR
jgi:hypothetical protein